MRALDVKNGTLSHHLYVLEKMGMIKSRREGIKYRAFYPTGTKFPKKEKYRLSDLQINIINTISKKPGITQKEISQMINQNKQNVSYNVKALEKAGKIKVIKKGRISYCYPIDKEDDFSKK